MKACQLQAAGLEGGLDLLVKVNTLEIWDLYRAGLTDIQAIRESFETQLSLPGPDLPVAWKGYQDWEQDKVRLAKLQERYLQVFAVFKKAERLFAQVKLDIKEQATQVITTHAEELAALLSLPAGTGVYEQTLVAFPTLSDLWRSYISFLVGSIQNEKKDSLAHIRKTLKRAARHSYWDLGHHLDLLLASEAMQKPCESNLHPGFFTQAFQCPFSQPEDYVTLWKAKYSWGRRNNADLERIYTEGVAWLRAYTQGLHVEYQRYVALGMKGEEGKAVFEEMVREQGSLFANWYHYAKWLEREGDIKALRSVLRRGLEFTKDQVKEMSELVMDTESHFSTVEEIRQIRAKVAKRLKRAPETVQKVVVSKPIPQPTAPTHLSKDSPYTVFVKNLSCNIRDDELKDLFAQVCRVKACRIVRNLKGQSKGRAYVDLCSDSDMQKCIETFNNTLIDGCKVTIAVSAPPEKANKDALTLFLINLPFELTEDELLSHCSSFGKVSDIRIPRNEKGFCKGNAYVEFAEEASVQRALEQKTIDVKGREVKILQANSQREQTTVLHVGNLEYTVTEEDLTGYFPQVKQACVPVDSEGKSRGFALVEFEGEEAAQFALSLQAPTIKGRPVVLRRSTREIKPKKTNADFKKLL